jgi:hypothetical protein
MFSFKSHLITASLLFSSISCMSTSQDKYSNINHELSPVWDLEKQAEAESLLNDYPAMQSAHKQENSKSIDELTLLLDDALIAEFSKVEPKRPSQLAVSSKQIRSNTPVEKDEIDYLYLLRPDANIRSDDLQTVIGRGQINDQVYLTGKKQSPQGTNYAYEEVTFADGSQGWVASHLLEPLENPTGEKRVIRVNLSTNRLSFHVDGKVVASWNVGTGKDEVENATPVGSYTLQMKDRCSVWLPKDKQQQGPCRNSNPLGDYQLWFHKGRTYALHGTNQEHLLEESTSIESRRVSSGCVRNPNEHIAWLYKRVKTGDTVEIGYFGDDSSTIVMRAPRKNSEDPVDTISQR